VSADSSCKKVTYPERNICAFEGSSVKFSCVYESWRTTPSVHWARSKSGHFQKVYSWHNRVQINTGRKESTLKITDLRESDSAKYHCQQSSRSSTWTSRFPGTTLTVRGSEEAQQLLVFLVLTPVFSGMLKSEVSSPSAGSVSMFTDPDLQVQVFMSPTGPKLVCHSRCLQDRFPVWFVWYENNQPVPGETSASYSRSVGPESSYSCGYLQHRSASVYAPTNASVTMSPPGGAVQNGSVTLTCQSDANPAAKYAWFRGNQGKPVREDGRLFFISLQASDCGEYFCTAQNQLGTKTSKRVSVELLYGPKSCSVSASPSAEVEQNSSVTLSCSSDANPAATYSWSKDSQSLRGGQHLQIIVQPEDRGFYSCNAANELGSVNSPARFLDVQCRCPLIWKVHKLL
ncbi:unnamed protein product, partial [Tetraodon nigroviridis]